MPPAFAGADLKRWVGAAGACDAYVIEPGVNPSARGVPTGGLLAAVPDGAVFWHARNPVGVPVIAQVICIGPPYRLVSFTADAVHVRDGYGWQKAGLDPADAVRVRAALLAAVAAAAPPPAPNPPGR